MRKYSFFLNFLSYKFVSFCLSWPAAGKALCTSPRRGWDGGMVVEGGCTPHTQTHTAHRSWPGTGPPGAHAGPARRGKHSGRRRTRGPPGRTGGSGGTRSRDPRPRTERLPRLPTSGRKHRTLKRQEHPVSQHARGPDPLTADTEPSVKSQLLSRPGTHAQARLGTLPNTARVGCRHPQCMPVPLTLQRSIVHCSGVINSGVYTQH